MRKNLSLLVVIGLLAGIGCNLEREHTVCVSRLVGGRDFEWDGEVTVHESYKGALKGYTVDTIRLKARDGRELIISALEPGIETFVCTEGERDAAGVGRTVPTGREGSK